MCCPETICPLL